MFVGGRVRVERPLIVGLEAEVRTSLERAEVKQGRAGEMLLVTLRRVFSQAGAGFLVEEQDLMYRSGDPTSPRPAVDDEHRDLPASEALWQRSMATDPLSLFLFSALTSNAHRIHYDLDYARDVEGYFGLVVQGPLLVLSMVELGRQEMAGRVVREIDFRLKSPVFSGDRVRVEGLRTGPNAAELSVVTHRSPSAATASLKFF
jgi:3-methylfumaryl-CoA hydratase